MSHCTQGTLASPLLSSALELGLAYVPILSGTLYWEGDYPMCPGNGTSQCPSEWG